MVTEGIKALCIFCGRTDKEVAFSREHVIPQSIGGRLLLLNHVCVDCNSRLGSTVDCEVVKLPDVLRAFAALGIPHDRAGILRRHYDVVGDLGGDELRHGRVAGEGFLFRPQPMPDGSLITPEPEYLDHLRRMVHRDGRLGELGLTQSELDARLEELRERYDAAEPGTLVEAPDIGYALLKRREPVAVSVTPRERALVEPLIAKIGYEVLFMAGPAEFASDENAQIRQLLLDAVAGDEVPLGLDVMRVAPEIPDFQPVHLIRLEALDYITLLRVGFFGCIEYSMAAPRMSEGYRANLKHQLGFEDTVGIQYAGSLEEDHQHVWCVRENGALEPMR